MQQRGNALVQQIRRAAEHGRLEQIERRGDEDHQLERRIDEAEDLLAHADDHLKRQVHQHLVRRNEDKVVDIKKDDKYFYLYI